MGVGGYIFIYYTYLYIAYVYVCVCGVYMCVCVYTPPRFLFPYMCILNQINVCANNSFQQNPSQFTSGCFLYILSHW